AVQVTRVTGQVFLRTKLRRIHVNAHHDFAGLADSPPRHAHEAQVTFVQIAHRGHKANARAAPLPLSGLPLHRGDRGDDSHGGKVSEAGRPINLNCVKAMVERRSMAPENRPPTPPDVRMRTHYLRNVLRLTKKSHGWIWRRYSHNRNATTAVPSPRGRRAG